MVDRYTKVVLSIIAAALVVLVVQNGTRDASAVGGDCGSLFPCVVTVKGAVEVYQR